MPLRQNHLQRQVEEALEAVRRIRLRRREGEPGDAARDADDAVAALLGPSAAVAARLDPSTAAQLIRDAEQVALWACLEAEKAAALDGPAAHASAARALRLAREALALDQEERRLTPGLRAALAEAVADARAVLAGG
jgi:hypothetical protein